MTLTEREDDVLQLLRAGNSYKQIASVLGIALGTATVHGSRALRKLRRSRLAVIASTETRSQKTDK